METTLLKYRPKKCIELIEMLPEEKAWVRIEGTEQLFIISKEELYKNYEKVNVWDENI